MLRRSFIRLVASLAALLPLGLGSAAGADGYRVSGPVVHENLAIYFVHGRSTTGATPITLQEAMAKGTVKVHETGNVNELTIENLGNAEVFVQIGDIVKGGQQDRVLTVSLVLPPNSGRVPIAAFCVEQGRWAPRGKEDVKTFSGSAAAMPSKAAKTAMRYYAVSSFAPTEGRPPAGRPMETSVRQQEMWDAVKRTQDKLTRSVGVPAVAPASPSSLQLSLETDKIKQAQDAYVKALEPAGEKDTDVVGYVFAINGKLNSADIYPTNELFRKMWGKLLRANATEAIGEKGDASETPPSTDAVLAFLQAAESGKKQEKTLPLKVQLETRDGDKALYSELRRADGSWVHRSYLAK
jgi:hypothetical protein